jgi:hypothetical protein
MVPFCPLIGGTARFFPFLREVGTGKTGFTSLNFDGSSVLSLAELGCLTGLVGTL